jgi:tetratricopeptide (TPR) repeat protein
MRSARGALWLAALLLAGCAGLLPSAEVAPAQAPEGMRGLKVAVAERVAIVTGGSIGAGFDETLRSALEGELARAGLVVTDEGGAEVTARLEAQVDGAAGMLRGRGGLTVVRGSDEVESLNAEQQVASTGSFPQVLARRLVALLVASPRLQSLATRLHPAGAVASDGARSAPPADGGRRPPSEAVAAARQHTRQGTSFYNLDRFAEALAEYQAAYLAAPDPALLFNIAQCQRRLGRRTEALDYYRKYLRNSPGAPNRAEVERHIRELDAHARR